MKILKLIKNNLKEYVILLAVSFGLLKIFNISSIIWISAIGLSAIVLYLTHKDTSK